MLVIISAFKKSSQSKLGVSKNATACKVIVSNLVKLFKSIGVENLFNPGYINIVYQIVRSPIHLPPHFFRVFNHLRTLLTTSKLIFPTLYLHPEGYLRLNL